MSDVIKWHVTTDMMQRLGALPEDMDVTDVELSESKKIVTFTGTGEIK